MVYELLWDCFVLDDYASGFEFIFKVCGHIVHGHVPPSVSHLFATSQLLALQKQMDNIRPIMIGKVTYWLITLTLAIQFRDTFAEHFNPH